MLHKFQDSKGRFFKGMKSNRIKISDAELFRYYQKRRYSLEKIMELKGISRKALMLRIRTLGLKIRVEDKKKGGNNKHGHYKVISDYKKLHNECESCCWDISVDIHHIIPISEKGNNVEINLIALCPNCHRMAHLDLLSKETLFNLKKTER